nr:MAG TPA: hypothetical protein [Caudoviricetes sp.]
MTAHANTLLPRLATLVAACTPSSRRGGLGRLACFCRFWGLPTRSLRVTCVSLLKKVNSYPLLAH